MKTKNVRNCEIYFLSQKFYRNYETFSRKSVSFFQIYLLAKFFWIFYD